MVLVVEVSRRGAAEPSEETGKKNEYAVAHFADKRASKETGQRGALPNSLSYRE